MKARWAWRVFCWLVIFDLLGFVLVATVLKDVLYESKRKCVEDVEFHEPIANAQCAIWAMFE